MDDKTARDTARHVAINTAILLLYLRFGSLFFWSVAVVVGGLFLLVAITMEVLCAWFPALYERACQLHKKIFGFSYIRSLQPPKIVINKKAMALNVFATLVSTAFLWLVYLRVSEVVRQYLPW